MVVEYEVIEDEDELVKVKKDLKDATQFAYRVLAERDQLRIENGRLEGVIEEVRAMAEAHGSLNSEEVLHALAWSENPEFYDQSWMHPWYHETLAEKGHLCGRDFDTYCEGCKWLAEDEEDRAADRA